MKIWLEDGLPYTAVVLTQFVFSKTIDQIAIENLVLQNFDVEVGVMDYGMTLDGIIGIDFLLQVGAVIDLAQLRIFRV